MAPALSEEDRRGRTSEEIPRPFHRVRVDRQPRRKIASFGIYTTLYPVNVFTDSAEICPLRSPSLNLSGDRIHFSLSNRKLTLDGLRNTAATRLHTPAIFIQPLLPTAHMQLNLLLNAHSSLYTNIGIIFWITLNP